MMLNDQDSFSLKPHVAIVATATTTALRGMSGFSFLSPMITRKHTTPVIRDQPLMLPRLGKRLMAFCRNVGEGAILMPKIVLTCLKMTVTAFFYCDGLGATAQALNSTYRCVGKANENRMRDKVLAGSFIHLWQR